MKTKKNVIVFGLGTEYRANKNFLSENFNVIGLTDNCAFYQGAAVDGTVVISPEMINTLQYDLIIVTPKAPSNEDICRQLTDMRIPSEKIVADFESLKAQKWLKQYCEIFGEYIRPHGEKLVSSVCRPTDLESITEWNHYFEALGKSRKAWEFVYICQALKERGMLKPGAKGICFAVGKERLPSIFASLGCKITATDAPLELSGGWGNVGAYCGNLDDLFEQDILSKEKFIENVSFKAIDMNNIPAEERGYDFLWSACALEHLGSMHAAKEFIYRSMNCLKTGGIAVHTTEYNLKSSVETLLMGAVSAMRSVDLIEVAEHLEWQGCHVEPLDFRLDAPPSEHDVALPPYSAPYYKILHKSQILTSFGLIARKGL